MDEIRPASDRFAGAGINEIEDARFKVAGKITGIARFADGTVEERTYTNIMTDYSALLFAQLAKGEQVPGITRLAVGTGVGSGDLQNPEPASATMTRLENEIARKAVNISYNTLEATVNDGIRTNVLDLTVQFAETEAVGPITEMALFGGVGSENANGGTIINAKRFPVWNKPDTATLTWTWRLVF
jgi:hypothetical protein